jgi:asparagine synthase (glutamine-hydrolysing)
VSARILAGRWDPRGAGAAPGDLADAIGEDGPGLVADHGALALAWTADPEELAHSRGVLCVLDGTVENAGALARELDLQGGPSTEEVLAAGWRRWGRELPARLEGEFVLVAWDSDLGQGVLARGGLGQRPMFVADTQPGVLFASEVRNLLALLPRRPPPDRLSVAHWLARTGLRDGRTLHEGIRRLEPGTMLVLGDGATSVQRFWAPVYTAPGAVSREDARAALSAGMQAAVDRALRRAGPAGILLSGGFDSGSVAALAVRATATAQRPRTYSGLFPDHPELDESDRIAAVRETLGLAGVEAEIHGGSPLAAALEFQADWQTPSVSPNWFAWSPLVRRARDDGVVTLLDGEGGDELFGCAPYLIADRLRRGRVRSAANLARAVPGMGPSPSRRLVRRALVQFGARAGLPPAMHALLRRTRGRDHRTPAWLAGDIAAAHRADDDPWAWKRTPGPRWWAARSTDLTAGPESLGAADQLRREAASADLRFGHPYRDRALVELVLTLPPELAFDARLDRPLAREAMRGELPDVVRDSDRKPVFNRFLADALEGDLAFVRHLVGAADAAIRPFVDPAGLRAAVLDVPPARRGPGWPLDVWRVATLECWLRGEADHDAPRELAERLKAGPQALSDRKPAMRMVPP